MATDPWADEPAEGGGTATATKADEAPADKADAPKADPAPEVAKKAAPAAKKAAPAAAAPPAAPAATGGLLSASLEDQVTILSLLLYGPEGTGKTTDALRMTKLCKPHQRVVLVDAEAGAKIKALKQRDIDVDKIVPWPTKVIDGQRVPDPGKIDYDGFVELLAEIEANPGVVIGVVWDSGTEITKRILDDVVAASTESDRKKGKARAPFQVNLEDHGVASSMLRDLLRQFRDLGVHLVITALERRDTDPDTGKVKYGPAMSPAMANDAAGLVDIVGYTMVDEVGPDSTEVRSARFVPIERRRAKDRYGLLPGKLADPYFDRIFEYIEGTLTKDNDPVQARVRELATKKTEGDANAQAAQ